jgi:hypothetical protein
MLANDPTKHIGKDKIQLAVLSCCSLKALDPDPLDHRDPLVEPPGWPYRLNPSPFLNGIAVLPREIEGEGIAQTSHLVSLIIFAPCPSPPIPA